MMSMMDSTTAVVALMVLLVVVTVGVLVLVRVLAARDGETAPALEHVESAPQDGDSTS